MTLLNLTIEGLLAVLVHNAKLLIQVLQVIPTFLRFVDLRSSLIDLLEAPLHLLVLVRV